MKISLALTLAFFASTAVQADAEEKCEAGACDASSPQTARALLQVKNVKGHSTTCSYQLQADQDGSSVCGHLQELDSYTSGSDATLDEAGYQETAALCCHHEMSLFVRREIKRQGFDVCDLSDLHGFVHWYDCSSNMTRSDVRRAGDDAKNFAQMQAEIAGVMTGNCPWLGHLPNCPVKGENCNEFPPCHPDAFPADSESGSSASLDDAGYAAVAKRCCHNEMEPFVRRQIDAMGFQVCDEGALQGFLHWFDCSSADPVHDKFDADDEFGDHYDDDQSFKKLQEGLIMARSGLPPLCPWLGGVGEACPPTGHNCPVVEVPEPEAHRRRTACR